MEVGAGLKRTRSSFVLKLNNKRKIQWVIAKFLLLLLNAEVQAAIENTQQPVWEVGLAVGALSMPHYMGSDQRYTLPLGLPYLVYRGEFVRVSRRGVKGLLVSGEHFSLDLGLSFSLPVNNDNNARDGMPDLNLTGQAGPRLNWKFSTTNDLPQLSLHVPARYVLDTTGKKLGWVTEPSLKIEKKHWGAAKNLSLRMDLGVLFAGKSFNKYYYGVADRFAKSNRPSFEAESGFHSYFSKLSATYRKTRHLSFGAFIQLRDLSQGVVNDSPLVRQSLDVSAGVGFVWSIWQSEKLDGHRWD
ncbi:MAG: MipA/OmpV family protein [Gammaproteobacteria bacterium]